MRHRRLRPDPSFVMGAVIMNRIIWIVCGLLIASSALAAKSGKQNHEQAPPTTQTAMPDLRANAQKVADTQREVDVAQKALDSLVDQLRVKFEATSEWTAANAEVA